MPQPARALAGAACALVLSTTMFTPAAFASDAEGDGATTSRNAISAAADPLAAAALEQLSALRGCDAHSSVILSPADSVTYSKLGMHLTCEPQYETNKLYHR